MAKNISLLGANYPDVPAVQLPQTGGGTAMFYDPDELGYKVQSTTFSVHTGNFGERTLTTVSGRVIVAIVCDSGNVAGVPYNGTKAKFFNIVDMSAHASADVTGTYYYIDT